ncbi:MAG: hypothetical protein QOI84_1223 [Solirubrobacterales bacterium]|jgi:hypothetical protein|nr:hypothetical protein [Solirubrobacterales bacterium]
MGTASILHTVKVPGKKVGLYGLFLALAAVAPSLAAAPPPPVEAGWPPFQLEGHVTPMKLPKLQKTPIALTVGGKLLHESDSAGALRELTLDFDRRGTIDPGAFDICRRSQLAGDDRLRRCRGAVVATGVAHVSVGTSSSLTVPLTAINGGWTDGIGRLFIVASSSGSDLQPLATTVQLTKLPAGPYGLRAVVKIPPIANGGGKLLDFQLRFMKAARHGSGYVQARCPDGHLRADVVSYGFSDGPTFRGEPAVRTCLPDIRR